MPRHEKRHPFELERKRLPWEFQPGGAEGRLQIGLQ